MVKTSFKYIYLRYIGEILNILNNGLYSSDDIPLVFKRGKMIFRIFPTDKVRMVNLIFPLDKPIRASISINFSTLFNTVSHLLRNINEGMVDIDINKKVSLRVYNESAEAIVENIEYSPFDDSKLIGEPKLRLSSKIYFEDRNDLIKYLNGFKKLNQFFIIKKNGKLYFAGAYDYNDVLYKIMVNADYRVKDGMYGFHSCVVKDIKTLARLPDVKSVSMIFREKAPLRVDFITENDAMLRYWIAPRL